MRPSLIISPVAIVLAASGVALLFLPGEVSAALGQPEASELPWSLVGAALFGLGLLNWQGRNAVYGGIYGRPILLGNVAHAFAGFMTLVNVVHAGAPWPLWAATVFYGLYAAGYARIMVRPPYTAATDESPTL